MSGLRFCPIKGTMVLLTTCEKRCSYSPEKCAAAQAAIKEGNRYCIDCIYYGVRDEDICKACLAISLRRPLWEPRDSVPIPAIRKSNNDHKQLSLF